MMPEVRANRLDFPFAVGISRRAPIPFAERSTLTTYRQNIRQRPIIAGLDPDSAEPALVASDELVLDVRRRPIWIALERAFFELLVPYPDDSSKAVGSALAAATAGNCLLYSHAEGALSGTTLPVSPGSFAWMADWMR